jgi:hypothetical protein
MSDPLSPFPVPAPDASLRQAILATLRDLETDPSGNTEARRRLRGWLPDAADMSQQTHLDLQELQDLARRRGQQGAAFDVPEHLLECRVCMELFQVLCENKNEASAAGTQASAPLLDPSDPAMPTQPAPRLRPRRLPALAAALLLGLWLWGFLRSPNIILENGNLQSNGDILRDGRVPARASLEALRRTQLRFLDGSRIELEPGARIRVLKNLALKPLLSIEAGLVQIDFLDADSAASLRIGDLHILPASAAFQINRSTQAITLSVQRGELELRQGSETRRLREGETNVWSISKQ